MASFLKTVPTEGYRMHKRHILLSEARQDLCALPVPYKQLFHVVLWYLSGSQHAASTLPAQNHISVAYSWNENVPITITVNDKPIRQYDTYYVISHKDKSIEMLYDSYILLSARSPDSTACLWPLEKRSYICNVESDKV